MESGENPAFQPIISRSNSPQLAARTLQTETRALEALLMNSDIDTSERNAQAAQASGSLPLLHTTTPSATWGREAFSADLNEAGYVGGSPAFAYSAAVNPPMQDVATGMTQWLADAPRLLAPAPQPVVTTVTMPSSQGYSASIASRAFDVRLQSPSLATATASASTYAAQYATSDVGRLATSALVAGRDVAPLGTVFVQAQRPQQQLAYGTLNGSYSFSSSPPGSVAVSPPRSLSPPCPRVVRTVVSPSPVQRIPVTDATAMATATRLQPVASAIQLAAMQLAAEEPPGSPGPVVFSPTPPQQARESRILGDSGF